MNFVQSEQTIQLLRDLTSQLDALHKDLDKLERSIIRLSFSIERQANKKD